MTLLAFAAVWVCAWALCWFGLERVWPTYTKRWRDVIRVPDRDVEPSPGFVGGMAFRPGEIQEVRVAGARTWSVPIATAVTIAIDWIVLVASS